MSYRVLVDDNFHYMDESRRRTLGEFRTYLEALTAAKQLVDACLLEAQQPGATAHTLYQSYTMFGDDPFIVADSQSPDVEPRFSAWDYARARCEELCPRQPAEPSTGV
jgi:hypothetical protein